METSGSYCPAVSHTQNRIIHTVKHYMVAPLKSFSSGPEEKVVTILQFT